MKLLVKDVMTSTVVSVNRRTNVDDAFELLLRHHISGLPVVDDDQRLVGVISERDLLGLLYDPHSDESRVSEYASDNVVSVGVDDLLPEAVDLFLSHPFRRLPVVDGENRLVGIVSRHDVIRMIRDVHLKIGAMIQRRRRAHEMKEAREHEEPQHAGETACS